MADPRRVCKVFEISVCMDPEERREVEVVVAQPGAPHGEDHDFVWWMAACEYFLMLTSRKSNAGFEKAQELLCSGATKWKDKR